jgi:hypothetical protein
VLAVPAVLAASPMLAVWIALQYERKGKLRLRAWRRPVLPENLQLHFIVRNRKMDEYVHQRFQMWVRTKQGGADRPEVGHVVGRMRNILGKNRKSAGCTALLSCSVSVFTGSPQGRGAK